MDLESMKSLSISDVTGLTALPPEIFHIILSHLDTAKSISRLALTNKGLCRLIYQCGWRIFVTSRFNTLSLPEISSPDEWVERARALTSQSRDWDRRGFTIDVVQPPANQRTRVNRYNPGQSIASNVLVDAHHQRQGNEAQDLMFWGAGEDIFALIRHTRGPKARTEEWLSCRGSSAGYRSGRDDVTSVSILKDHTYGQGDGPQALVGRANGELDLVSMNSEGFGKKLLSFRTVDTKSHIPNGNTTSPTEIQSIDVHYKRRLLAAGTKQSIQFYDLTGVGWDGTPVADGDDTDTIQASSDHVVEVQANKVIPLKEELQGSWAFEFIRSIKFINENTLAVGLNKSGIPLQYLKCTEAGFECSAEAKMYSSGRPYRYTTVRAILPVNTNSIANGSGNSVLSSWNDGRIRLQDLRTPSHIDQIFQDNFDISTPLSSLLSYGLERFVAGSAHSPVVKVFDYRWPKRYYHTEALSCGDDHPYPRPRPPTYVTDPDFPSRSKCDHMAGLSCRWHARSRCDFYRPNVMIWLPAISASPHTGNSPIYSLASPSDESPSLFAGLSGGLVEMTARSGPLPVSPWPVVAPGQTRSQVQSVVPYYRSPSNLAFIETGSGFPIQDTAQTQRVPPLYNERDGGQQDGDARCRFDEWIQSHE